MRVTVNGEVREAAPGASLLEFLALLGIDPAKVAIERNLEIAPRSTWPVITMAEDDRLEIVQFVGGG
jgi:thiamine biosynthesis protein ThiS